MRKVVRAADDEILEPVSPVQGHAPVRGPPRRLGRGDVVPVERHLRRLGMVRLRDGPPGTSGCSGLAADLESDFQRFPGNPFETSGDERVHPGVEHLRHEGVGCPDHERPVRYGYPGRPPEPGLVTRFGHLKLEFTENGVPHLSRGAVSWLIGSRAGIPVKVSESQFYHAEISLWRKSGRVSPHFIHTPSSVRPLPR